ncbi:MAG: hypothetical protein GEU78_05475 [Actinobacteria bacterium]|nr:hypothetical protein [Actinomycetota bacterium]
MSDFIERVAARAVGAAPLARPRPSALFEEPGEAVDHPLEMAHEEIVAHPAPAPVTDAAPPPHDPPPPVPASAPAPRRAERGVPAHGPKGPEPRAPAAHEPEPPPAAHEPEPPPAAHEPEPLLGERERERPAMVSSARGRPRATAMTPLRDDAPDQREIELASPGRSDSEMFAPPHEPDRVASVARPAVAASSHVPVSAAPAPATATRVSEEPPPVRVHIGRLEVRANLNQAPRQPSRHETRQSERLSLADYLRGKREVDP